MLKRVGFTILAGAALGAIATMLGGCAVLEWKPGGDSEFARSGAGAVATTLVVPVCSH